MFKIPSVVDVWCSRCGAAPTEPTLHPFFDAAFFPVDNCSGGKELTCSTCVHRKGLTYLARVRSVECALVVVVGVLRFHTKNRSVRFVS